MLQDFYLCTSIRSTLMKVKSNILDGEKMAAECSKFFVVAAANLIYVKESSRNLRVWRSTEHEAAVMCFDKKNWTSVRVYTNVLTS